jgi:hypothetical protein
MLRFPGKWKIHLPELYGRICPEVTAMVSVGFDIDQSLKNSPLVLCLPGMSVTDV